MNRDVFAIDPWSPVRFAHTVHRDGLCATWECHYCNWHGQTDPRPHRADVEVDAKIVAENHGYGKCVP